jgi:hypothetical protein
MKTENEVHVKINSHYTATIRDLKSFENYFYDNFDYDLEVLKIVYINEKTESDFINSVKKIIEKIINIWGYKRIKYAVLNFKFEKISEVEITIPESYDIKQINKELMKYRDIKDFSYFQQITNHKN